MEVNQVAEITVSYKPIVSRMPLVMRSQEAYAELMGFFPEELLRLQEQLVVMYLNRANRIIGIYRHSLGGITGTIADPRLILGTALKVAATAIILAHNHPSGNLRPSRADELLTSKIKEACKCMDIQLSDHIIVSANKGEYFSFADNGIT